MNMQAARKRAKRAERFRRMHFFIGPSAYASPALV
jgi:hypothetical protein